MKNGLRLLKSDIYVLKMMKDTRIISNVAAYVQHGMDKIDFDLMEAPPAFPTI